MRKFLVLLLLLLAVAPAVSVYGACDRVQSLLSSEELYDREEGLYQLSVTPGCRGALGDELLRLCAEDVFANADYAYQLLRAYYRPEQVAAGRQRLLENFTARLRDPDPRLRLESLERIGKFKHEALSALPELVPLCRDDDPYVALAAAKAIRTLDGADGSWFPVALRTLLEHRNGNVQLYGLRRIAKLRQFDPQTLAAVRRLDDAEVRKNVRRWKDKVLSMAESGALAEDGAGGEDDE